MVVVGNHHRHAGVATGHLRHKSRGPAIDPVWFRLMHGSVFTHKVTILLGVASIDFAQRGRLVKANDAVEEIKPTGVAAV